MKKFFKYVFILFILGGLGVGGYYVYMKYFTKKHDAFKAIPADAIFAVETSNLTKAWNTIGESKMWKHLIANPYFKDINETVKQVDTYVKGNKALDLLMSGKKLIVSAHMVSGTAWDMLFVVDLENVAGITGGLQKALGLVSGYKMQPREFKGIDILQLISEQNPKDIIYLAVLNNLLIVSFNATIIENSISQKDDQHWDNNARFRKVVNELSDNHLFKFYFNYSQLGKFAQSYLGDQNDVVEMLGKSLSYSAFNINLENEKLSFDGATNLDSIASYVHALAGVSPGKIKSHLILSDQTAFMFSMNFSDYQKFHSNLLEEFAKGNASNMEDVEKGIYLVEKLLSISIQDDLFSWFGNEIAFAKLRPKANTRMEDVIVAIHAKDIESAKKGLGHITQQIRRRSPLKFETVNYRNFEIDYLEQKGLFKLFFGKLFDKLEKPFFTFIEDYVVMSNSMDALKNNIDDYIAGKTLSHNAKFNDFKDNFEAKGNITLFVQMPKIYSLLYFFSPEQKKKGVKENKDLILSFSLLGFQLSSKGDMFKTSLIANYDESVVADEELEKFESEVCDDLYNKEIDSLGFKVKLPENIQLPNGPYKENYADGTTVKVEGTIKNNNLEGLWRSFYESGNIKSSVTYKENKANGAAYFYYDDTKGTKRVEVKMDDDQVVDKYHEYYPNGVQKAIVEYKRGKMHGDAQFFYPSGKLKIEAEYKAGLRSGKWKYYDENGELISKEKWKKGSKK